jgi:hypothetical protein
LPAEFANVSTYFIRRKDMFATSAVRALVSLIRDEFALRGSEAAAA